MDNFPEFIRNVKKYESPKLAGCKINLPFNAVFFILQLTKPFLYCILLLVADEGQMYKCDSGVVGNARPCQGRDRGFEPRLSLLFKGAVKKE